MIADTDPEMPLAIDTPADQKPLERNVSRDAVIELIELLYFGYRDFTSDPDVLLLDFGFGRAHHRVVHFVGRNPGISVAELLDILRITKQSLARVLKELVERGIIEQRSGSSDRRRRLLHLTEDGAALHNRLMQPQIERVQAAIRHAGGDAAPVFQQILYGLINEEERGRVEKVVSP
ncbi:MAG: MarR family transcriptional regulator [Pseudomonadota bacterium]